MAFRDPAAEQQSSRAAEPSFSFVQHSALFGIALLFALGTSVLSWSNARTADLAPRFHWPDETTNHFFALRVARGESLAVPEPRNFDAGNIIHPRTMNVRADGVLVPGSYLGLPLWYGVVGRVLGERAMLFVTPILAALGLLAFASIVRRFRSPIVAVVATILLALHPSVWLFTVTAFLPNVPFVALLLIGFAVFIPKSSSRGALGDEGSHMRIPGSNSVRFLTSLGMTRAAGRWLLGGLLIGLALTLRTHELVWVGAMLAVLIVRNCSGGLRAATSEAPRAATWRAEARRYTVSVVAVLVGLVIPFIPIFFLNTQLYGSPFTTGYALLQDGGATPTEFAASFLPGWLMALIAPFGWHPVEAFSRFWKYMVVPFPWFIGLAVLGIAIACVIRAKAQVTYSTRGRVWNMSSKLLGTDVGSQYIYQSSFATRHSASAIVGSIILTVWLILYYGSWTIADPLVRETNVLTISYVRYWLPIVVILAPWVAMGLLAIVGRMPTRWRAHTIALVFLGIALTSFTKVVTDPSEGLLRQRQAIDEHRARARAVIAATEQNAVIVSHRMDKVFFPERAVVHAPDPLSLPPRTGGREGEGGRGDGDPFLRNLQALAGQSPVYWYAPDVVQLSGSALVPVSGMPLGEFLYRIGM